MSLKDIRAYIQNGIPFTRACDAECIDPKAFTEKILKNGGLEELKKSVTSSHRAMLNDISKSADDKDYDLWLEKRGTSLEYEYVLAWWGKEWEKEEPPPPPLVLDVIRTYHKSDMPTVLGMRLHEFSEYLNKYPNLKLFLRNGFKAKTRSKTNRRR